MRCSLLLFSLFLLISSFGKAQSKSIHINFDNYFVMEKMPDFHVERIVDARDKNKMDSSINTLNLKFDRVLEEELLILLGSKNTGQSRKLALRINELVLQEKQSKLLAGRNIFKITLNITYLEHRNNQYFELFTANESNIIQERFEQSTIVHTKNIVTVFNQCHQIFYKKYKQNKLYVQRVLSADSVSKNINKPIIVQKGLFEDFYDFKNHTIDSTKRFSVSYKLSNNKNKIVASLLDVKKDSLPWGFRDNNVNFIQVGKNKYLPLRDINDKQCFFYDYLDDNTSSTEDILPFILSGATIEVFLSNDFVIGSAYNTVEEKTALVSFDNQGVLTIEMKDTDSLDLKVEHLYLFNSFYSQRALTYTIDEKEIVTLQKREAAIYRIPNPKPAYLVCVINEDKEKSCKTIELYKSSKDVLMGKTKKDKPITIDYLRGNKSYEALNDLGIGHYTLKFVN